MNAHGNQRRFSDLRSHGVDVTETKGLPKSEAIGAGFPGADKAREAKAKAEAARAAASAALDALDKSGEYVTAAKRDAALAKLVEAHKADAEAGYALATAIENGREDAILEWGEEREEAVARVKVLLEKVTDELSGIGTANRVIAAARSDNPGDRYAKPRPGAKPGGQALAALVTAVENIDLPQYVIMDGPTHRRWLRGEREGVRDIFGEPVPDGIPANRVRRSYAPMRDVPTAMVATEGGVA